MISPEFIGNINTYNAVLAERYSIKKPFMVNMEHCGARFAVMSLADLEIQKFIPFVRRSPLIGDCALRGFMLGGQIKFGGPPTLIYAAVEFEKKVYGADFDPSNYSNVPLLNKLKELVTGPPVVEAHSLEPETKPMPVLSHAFDARPKL